MPRKPNVLVMVDSFDMGGAESQGVLLARLLRDDGAYGVSLACLRREGVLLDEAQALGLGHIPEYRLTSFYNRNMITQLARFVSFLKERRIDVVHPQSFYTNIFGITGAALARTARLSPPSSSQIRRRPEPEDREAHLASIPNGLRRTHAEKLPRKHTHG